MKFEFSRQVFEKYPNIKIRLAGAKLFCADLQTDMTKLIVAFRSFAKWTPVLNQF
jgi:hypothetical protein